MNNNALNSKMFNMYTRKYYFLEVGDGVLSAWLNGYPEYQIRIFKTFEPLIRI